MIAWHTLPEPRRLLAAIKLERPTYRAGTDGPSIRYEGKNAVALRRIHNALLDEAYDLDRADWERTGVMGPRYAELMADAPDKIIGLLLGDIIDIWTADTSLTECLPDPMQRRVA
jgi:hypothetical protein